ncbi:MAG: FAD-dependent oxidoreductase [Candidatus Cloacimonetes bacterium]|nr:FAD-dependent oxidoreductase [Candidatus Cloacimonadota bacterium]
MTIKIILDGKEVETVKGKTILEVAGDNGIEIPTLCHDEELKPYGSCWVCAVEVKGRRGFITACATEVTEGMEINTNTPEVFAARKMALELLLSDHYADCEAPCKIACPDKVDIQTYVSLIANGQYHEAVRVIKENLPMPLSIGRVCPAFCEKECRRTIVEEPIAIRQLKRFAADFDLNDSWSYVPTKKESKNQKIAIIGAGPSGLTCGYYLSNEGYDVTIYESAPAAGGWLRYGIPEYRLPKSILDAEIKLMCANGMKIETGIELGKDIKLSNLVKDYDAVYLALGAQMAVPMRVKGSNLQGVYLGVDFLKNFALGYKPQIGKKVAVVGGGNTAIDCARTAIRLGSDVTIIYRRTRKEMPAEAYEVDAADEEGIKFYMLTNPVEFIGEGEKLQSVKLEKMELGEPDASGRRSPQPTGEFFSEKFDTVIAAISQQPDVDFLAEDEHKINGRILPLSKWRTAEVDENTMYTGIENLFAGGDFRRGPATAIEAIADGRIAAEMIDRFLRKIPVGLLKAKFDSKKAQKLKEISVAEYEQYPKINRYKMPEIEAKERAANFAEVELGFSEEDAISEAKRCLECGCQVNSTCKLRNYATDYEVDVSRFWGSINRHPIDDSHPFILRDPNKCIKCGRCIRTCMEIQGAGVLGYIYRGFTTIVAPEFGESLTKTTCESCGKCIEVCPVGALVERNLNYKLNPHSAQSNVQNCGSCGAGCSIEVFSESGIIRQITVPEKLSFNGRNLCFKGKFGWQGYYESDRITTPQLLGENGYIDMSYSQISSKFAEVFKKSETRKIYISPDTTNEEILVWKKIAQTTQSKICSLSVRNDFIDRELKKAYPIVKYSDLSKAEAIVIIGEISQTVRTLARLEQRKGKKLVLINNFDNEFNKLADCYYQTDDVASVLEDMNKCKCGCDCDCDENIEKTGKKLPGKTIFIYNINTVSEEVIGKIWKLAVSVCDFSEGSGVISTSMWKNYNGLLEAKIVEGVAEETDLAIIYGEYPENSELERIFKSGTVISFNSFNAFNESIRPDILMPLPNYLEISGTAYSDDMQLTKFNNPTGKTYFADFLLMLSKSGLISSQEADPVSWIIDKVADELRLEVDKNVIQKQFESVDKMSKTSLSVNIQSYGKFEKYRALTKG